MEEGEVETRGQPGQTNYFWRRWKRGRGRGKKGRRRRRGKHLLFTPHQSEEKKREMEKVSARLACLLVGEIEKKKVVVRWRGKCGEGKYFLCGVGGGGVGEDGDGK